MIFLLLNSHKLVPAIRKLHFVVSIIDFQSIIMDRIIEEIATNG